MSVLPWLWIGLAVAAMVVELHAGTAYLLAAVVGFAMGGGLGLAGYGIVWQLCGIGIALLAGYPVAAWYRRKQAALSELLPDIGLEVEVLDAGPKGLRVSYRGSEWNATVPGGFAAAGDRLRIAAVRGNTLELQPLAKRRQRR